MKFNSFILAIAASFIALVFWLLIDNTYDLGDSITHYMISKSSWKYPYLLFDNWGKPVFTILSSPFAQFGWKGITLFNSLTGVISCCLIGQIIYMLKWKISPYCAILIFFIPHYPLALNSGLTEPLYALVLIAGLYFLIKKEYIWCALIISFLPYVRSEGFISAGVFFFIFVFAQQWKKLPYFFVGTLIISIAGYVFYMDSLLWLFNTNPYISTGVDSYGSGDWSDFFIKFYYLTGIPFNLLFWIASVLISYVVLNIMLKNFKQGVLSIEAALLLLFYSFFFAHVIFWKFGIFHSFGMSRVLISILPIALLIVLYLVNTGYAYTNSKIGLWAVVTLLAIFPFFVNKSSWAIPKDFVLDPEIVEIKKIKNDYKIKPEQYDKIYYSSIPLMYFLDCDIYDTTRYHSIVEMHDPKIFPGEKILVIKDDWFLKADWNIESSNPMFAKLHKVYSKKVSEKNTIEIYTNK